MSRDSSRKPSSSSTRSGTHSPTPSPGNVRIDTLFGHECAKLTVVLFVLQQPHSSRRITPTTTGNMLSVGVAGGAGLMSYSSGWEVRKTRKPRLSSHYS